MNQEVIETTIRYIAELAPTQEGVLQIIADARNVVAGLNRGAGCREDLRLHSINCGRVCVDGLRLCHVLQANNSAPDNDNV